MRKYFIVDAVKKVINNLKWGKSGDKIEEIIKQKLFHQKSFHLVYL